MREEIAMVNFAGVDKKGGKCRDGHCRIAGVNNRGDEIAGVDFAGVGNDGVIDSELQL